MIMGSDGTKIESAGEDQQKFNRTNSQDLTETVHVFSYTANLDCVTMETVGLFGSEEIKVLKKVRNEMKIFWNVTLWFDKIDIVQTFQRIFLYPFSG
jgi:hypothetical protein